MSVYKWRFGLFNVFTLNSHNSHLYFRVRKKEGFSSSPVQVQLHPEPGPTLWADEVRYQTQLRSFSTTHPYPEGSVTKLSWGQHQLLLQTEKNLNSGRTGSRFFTHLDFSRRFFVVVLLLWATSCLPGCSQEKCHDRNFLFSGKQLFWGVLKMPGKALALNWDEEKQHWEEKTFQQWQPCERIPLPADFHGSHQAGC